MHELSTVPSSSLAAEADALATEVEGAGGSACRPKKASSLTEGFSGQASSTGSPSGVTTHQLPPTPWPLVSPGSASLAKK